jgi:hypothetical protein
LPFPESGLVPLQAGEEITWQMVWSKQLKCSENY